MAMLSGVIVLLAVLTLVLAVREAMAMIRLSPSTQNLGNFFWLGWWKFGEIKTQIGPDAAPHFTIYKRAIITFLVFIALGMVLSGFAR